MNLGYATIVSPVDGTVVSRNVDVGQTVAASLSAPTLFEIARDLTKVQIEASVPEADIGRIHETQRASFMVDAYPDQTFEGVVSQVRLAATTVSNVVTYTVVIAASNPDGHLFPGMTANVTFEIARSARDALHVPAAALRVQPDADLVAETVPRPGGAVHRVPGERSGAGTEDGERKDATEGPDGGESASTTARPGRGRRAGARTSNTERAVHVFVPLPNGLLKAVRVRAGISDGSVTVVEPLDPSALPPGTEVVTAILRNATTSTTTNPFAPTPMRGRGGR